jgi:hypothetical protein
MGIESKNLAEATDMPTNCLAKPMPALFLEAA